MGQETKSRETVAITLLVAVALMLAPMLAFTPGYLAGAPQNTSGLATPVHLTHPMLRATSPTGEAFPISAASGSGCPLATTQCMASYNWAGYAVCEPLSKCLNGSAVPSTVTDVKGTWVVPAVFGASGSTCPDSQKTWFDASVWIGIDGFTSQTVEQTGTSSDCFYGHVFYYAWYEFYPNPSVTISNIVVKPGNTMTAEVSYSAGQFKVTITDVTTSMTNSSAPTTVPGADMNSAEWIVESAYASQGILSLTHVKQIAFTSASATLNGTARSISAWGSNVFWLLMIDYNWLTSPSTMTLAWAKAEPLALGTLGNNFKTNWLSAGP